jgi:hypothetical protein
MWSRTTTAEVRRTREIAALAVILAALAPAGPAAAAPGGVPVAALAACADAALPQEILAGSFPVATTPLAVIQAGGAAVPLTLAVADDERTRELGLMCVTRLRPHAGMIFVFADSEPQEFWMKNTLVPLDMLWVAPDGTVTSVAARVPASTRSTPDDRVARRTGTGMYVIELASGEAAADGIAAGTKLALPDLHSRDR